jgi:hypothetical protein
MGRDSDVAGFFDVNTSKLPKPRSTVVVLENSRFCERNLVDGAWVQADSQCKEEVRYKTVTVAGDYLTVRVDPALPKVSQR